MTTSTKPLIGLLVGMHFRPPAKIILGALPSGTTLYLKPEPENPYDENAVAVYVKSESIPEEQQTFISGALPGAGFTIEEVMAQPEWHLGYLAATGGKPLLKNPEYSGNLAFGEAIRAKLANSSDCPANLAFDGAGQAIVTFQPGNADANS